MRSGRLTRFPGCFSGLNAGGDTAAARPRHNKTCAAVVHADGTAVEVFFIKGEFHMDEREPKQPPAKSRFPLSRIVLLILLVVAIGGLIVDQTARRAAMAAKAKLDAAIGPDRPRRPSTATRDDVHKLLDREPDADSPNYNVEVYSWRGALRNYRVYAEYDRDGSLLIDASLGEPPH
jgi:hypothetical protein